MAKSDSIDIVIKKINQSRKEIETLKTQLTSMKQANSRLNQQLSNADPNKVKSLEDENADLSQRLTVSQERVVALEQELQSLTTAKTEEEPKEKEKKSKKSKDKKKKKKKDK